MNLSLHLGAHRTGSTSLQSYAKLRRGVLQAAGLTVWGPPETRDGRMTGLVKPADRVTLAMARQGRIACDRLRRRIDQVETPALLISEENMLGSMFANVRERRLYPDAAQRLARMRPAFARDCRRVGLAIRSYDRHWTSSLTYVMRKEQRGTSDQELRQLAAQPRRWTDVVADIAEAFPKAEVLVWPFEAMVDAPDAILSQVSGCAFPPAPQFFAQMRHHHPSPECAELRQGLKGEAARASVLGDGVWVPFDRETRARMRNTYAADIAWLRAGADGLARFIQTPEFTSPETTEGHPGQTRGPNHDQRQRRVG